MWQVVMRRNGIVAMVVRGLSESRANAYAVLLQDCDPDRVEVCFWPAPDPSMQPTPFDRSDVCDLNVTSDYDIGGEG